MPQTGHDVLSRLRRHVGNAALVELAGGAGRPPAVPSLVRDVLREHGNPLPVEVASAHERRVGVDLSDVRVHTDRRADRSARQLGALAYTWGRHVVLTERAQQDSGAVLRHELTHVRQQAGRTVGEPSGVVPAVSLAERRAERGDASPAEAGIALLRDPALDALLAKVPGMASQAWVTDPAVSVVALAALFNGVDVADDDNLMPIAEAIGAHYPPKVLDLFLRGADTVRTEKANRAAGERKSAATQEMLQPERRGAYGSRTPATPLTASAGLLAPAARPIGNAVQSVDAFLRGLERGFDVAGDPALYQRLQSKLVETIPHRMAMPVVFAAGAAVGIASDLVDAVKSIADLPDLVRQVIEFTKIIFSADGAAVAEEFGMAMGQHYRAEINRLLDKGATAFNYELGKLIGPSIVYLILSFLGVGLAELAAEAGVRLATTLRRSATLMKALEKVRKLAKPVAKGTRIYRDEKRMIRVAVDPPKVRVAADPPRVRVAVEHADELAEAEAAAAEASRRTDIAKRSADYARPSAGKPPNKPVEGAPRYAEGESGLKRKPPEMAAGPGVPKRPDLPTGANVPRLPFAPGRFTVKEERLRQGLRAAERAILDEIERDPEAATRLGNEYRDLVDLDLQTVADPKRTPEVFGGEGRRPDIGTSHEVTLEGRKKGFGSGKLDQIWHDLVKTGEEQLTVPKLSEAATDQLRRLGAQAEVQVGHTVRIYVRQTSP